MNRSPSAAALGTGAARGRRRVPGRDDDTGVTMVEMVVALSLLSVLLALFTTGVTGLYRSANHHEATVTAQSQIHLAFQRLDAEVRYATSISREGTAPGTTDWYVEYLSTASGTSVCGQLRLTARGLLQHRRWQQGAALPRFTTLASGVSGSHPFTRMPADDDHSLERLLVDVSASGGPDARSRQISIAFSALNSSADAADDKTCSEGRPTS